MINPLDFYLFKAMLKLCKFPVKKTIHLGFLNLSLGVTSLKGKTDASTA